MARLTGGIFSRPAGKTGGIVFGSARTRQGKLVTSRLLVPPSNPNTPAQQAQRSKFSEVLSIVRRFGSTIYQSDFNRSVGQLPGFQSMESIYLNQISATGEITLINPINLGTLHYPTTFGPMYNDSGSLTGSFSTELGSNGTVNDTLVVLAVAKLSANRSLPGGVISSTTTLRSSGLIAIAGTIIGEEYSVYVYFRGAGLSAGLLSVANPKLATVV